MDDLELARRVATVPVLVGSGVTVQTIPALRKYVDGVIVGTALKEGGDVAAPVDAGPERELVDAWSAD